MVMIRRTSLFLLLRYVAASAVLFPVLYAVGRSHYLLAHTLVELFSIIVASSIFIIAWNTRRFLVNGYLLFLGLAFVFIAALDVLHTLTYQGMGVLPDATANQATQLWIAARWMQALSFLAAPFFLRRPVKPALVLATYSSLTILLVATILYRPLFPDCYIEGTGLTTFKRVSEYLISILSAGAIGILFRYRREFDPAVLNIIAAALAATIVAELSFTLYEDLFGPLNFAGHSTKIVSFYLFYKAMIEVALRQPYGLLFRSLKQSEEAAQAERDRAQTYLDAAGSILLVVDRNETVSLINRKGSAVLGLPEKNIIGKNWFDCFVPEQMRETLRSTFGKIVHGEAEQVEYCEDGILTTGGEERLIAWRITLLRDQAGRITATLRSGEDITERRRTEEALAHKTAELERSNRDLELFASSVSHDLKAPLVTIGGFAEVIADKYSERLDPKGREHLERIFRQALRMERMINSLLDYSRVTTRGKSFSRVPLRAIVDAALENLKPLLDESGALVEIGPLPDLMGDEPQLVQLIQNLVANAVIYRGDASPRVTIRADLINEAPQKSSTTPGPAPAWRITVSDNGMGIPPEHREHVFEIFRRLPAAAGLPGTGVGLALCKRIVERHGGSIWVESEPGSGSAFHFILH